MTLRAKPVVKGPGRSGWNSEGRRSTLTNVGFVVAIAASILILLGYAGFSFYDDHFGAAAKVDGAVITKDQLRNRVTLETFRIDYTESRIRTLQTAGRITEASATSQIQYLEQRRNSIASVALERLIDITLQTRLAGEANITVSDANIDAQLQVEATVVEERHAWMIAVTPDNDPATGKPGDVQKAAAKAKVQQALVDIKAGKSWEDVAKTVSADTSAAQNGDLGWLPHDSGYDVPFMTAVFATAQNGMTDVIEGDDGVYRLGRVTEIAPATVDQTFNSRINDAGIKTDDYRAAVKADLIRKDLDAKIVADLSKPAPQRHVLQVFLTESAPMPGGVKVRHILISPNHDPSTASTASAQAWQAAKDEANQIYQQVIKDPSQFDLLARTKSDEGSAKSTGGKLPYYDAQSTIDSDFAKAILQTGLKPGQILAPVKSAFGWHVIQFMRPYGDGDAAWLKTIRGQTIAGADFAGLARDQGDGAEAAEGGDIGWVAKGQLGADKEAAIFAATVGGVSDVVTVANEGVYLWKVIGEETRTPTKDQIAIFKSSGFNDWYAIKKAAAKIERDVTTTTATQ